MSRLYGRIVAAVCVAGSLTGCATVPGTTLGYNTGAVMTVPAFMQGRDWEPPVTMPESQFVPVVDQVLVAPGPQSVSL